MEIKILFLMILLHIIDDVHLQGILAQMKQKNWWLKQKGYKDLYKNDYKMALLLHSMSWSIMILLPSILFLEISNIMLSTLFVSNTLIHYHADDLKANRGKINLITDQIIHIGQILITWMLITI